MNKIFPHILAFARGEKKFSLCWLLVPFNWGFSLSVAVRNFLYDHGIFQSIEPPLPVISIGNITIGGTNKTPFVEMLCRMLKDRAKVGIVSRGYGGAGGKSPVVFIGGQAEREVVGDEPLLLSSHLPDVPIAVSIDRLHDVRSLSSLGVELAIADDAFQHRKLGRDVDIVLIDSVCPFGNGTLLPSGILREQKNALSRAHILVITKVDQVEKEQLDALHENLEKIVDAEKIFTSRIVMDKWLLWDGLTLAAPGRVAQKLLPFSAIGNPESFHRLLARNGVHICEPKIFRDHHRYTIAEMESLVKEARASGADLVCTEKDIHNLPDNWTPPLPVWVPIVSTVLDEPVRFYEKLTECLRPHLVVASNGYGEDAIGVLLAERLRDNFPDAEIIAFPLVGRGHAYGQKNFEIYPEPSVTPSGGIIKYHLRELWRDIRSGLLGHISSQMKSWKKLRGQIRTPLCVGDVYLLFHTLWGQGCTPAFLATAKTVYLSGHWRSEKIFIARRSRKTWTRDPETAQDLAKSGALAVYEGSPIMDLSAAETGAEIFKKNDNENVILLLPGSRERAYKDIFLLLDAAAILQAQNTGKKRHHFVMVIAPTLDIEKISASVNNPKYPEISITAAPIASAAKIADIVIGLGGTANQVCAGYGVPVVSIDEKGKLVQKKLLGDSEILVPPTPEALAEATLKILNDPGLHSYMAKIGRARLGGAGAIDGMVRYADNELGWGLRCKVWRNLKK